MPALRVSLGKIAFKPRLCHIPCLPPKLLGTVCEFDHSPGLRAFLLVITMSEKIYYNRTAAEHFGSAVAAILLTCVVKKCEENNADTIEEVDLQFDLGFSDVEFFSALKTLREKGYLQSRTLRGGARLYVPIPELLDLRSKQ